MWRIVAMLVAVVLLVGIGFCLSTCHSEAADGRVELTLLDWNWPAYTKMNRQRIAIFEKANPDIKVRLVLGTIADPEKLLAMISGGVAPDVAYSAYQSMPYFAKRKAILPLDDFIANDRDFTMEMFFPAAVKAVRYNGKFYSVPDAGSPVAMFYNKNLFDQYNKAHPGQHLDYPSEKWTWKEFRHTAKALTADRDGDGRTDVFGTVGQFWSNRFSPYVWQNGGEVISADKRRCMMDSPEAIAAMQWLYDIMWVDKSALTWYTEIAGASQQTMETLFREQHVAMMMSTRYSQEELLGKTSFQWDIAPLPRGPVRRATVYVGGQWMISSQTRHPEKAWRLAKFLVSDLSSEMSMRAGRAMAANRAVTERLLKHPGIPPENDHIWVQIMADARPKDFQFIEMGSYLRKAMDELIYISQGRRKPEEACRNFARIYNEGLKILWEEEGGP